MPRRTPNPSILLQVCLALAGLLGTLALGACSRATQLTDPLSNSARSGQGTFAPRPPVGNPVIQSLTFFPATVEGGAPATGRITFDRVTDGALVALVSSDPTVVSVPAEGLVPGQQQSGDYPITTFAVSAPTTVTITGTAFGGESTTSATITVVPATGPPVPDVVTIKSMTWRAGLLKISAASSEPNAILSAYLSGSDSFMFNLTNDGRGKFSDQRGWNVSPVRITIKSNFGGSAVSDVR